MTGFLQSDLFYFSGPILGGNIVQYLSDGTVSGEDIIDLIWGNPRTREEAIKNLNELEREERGGSKHSFGLLIQVPGFREDLRHSYGRSDRKVFIPLVNLSRVMSLVVPQDAREEWEYFARLSVLDLIFGDYHFYKSKANGDRLKRDIDNCKRKLERHYDETNDYGTRKKVSRILLAME